MAMGLRSIRASVRLIHFTNDAWPSLPSRSQNHREAASSCSLRCPRKHTRKRWLVSPVSVAQSGTQFLRHAVRVDAVANDLRPNEDDELGACEPP